MEFSNLARQKRIEEMIEFKAVLDIDFPDDPVFKAPYEKVYNDYINGLISGDEFDYRVTRLVKEGHFGKAHSKFADETELHLAPEEAKQFLQERFSK